MEPNRCTASRSLHGAGRSALLEPRRYRRGPIWAVVNWMIAEGLSDCGERALAQTIRTDSDESFMIDAGGFSEYFDPLTRKKGSAAVGFPGRQRWH